jgi:CysZ protein
MTPDSSPSAVGDLFKGVGFVPRALAMTFGRPKVLMLSLLCAAVTALCLAVSAYFLWSPARALAERIVGSGGGWRDWLGIGLSLLLYLAMLAATWLTVPAAVLAPLQDPLSEAVEEALGDFTAPPFSLARAARGVGLSLSHTGLRLALQLLGYAVLFPLNFIPVAGSVIWAVVSAVWTMWWLATEYLSGPMARHLYPFGRVLKTMRKRPALSFGFGAALHLLLFIPVVNFFLVPLAVVGSTLFFRHLAAQGNIER